MATDEHEVLENYITQHNLKITNRDAPCWKRFWPVKNISVLKSFII